jgi:hypothetical protein
MRSSDFTTPSGVQGKIDFTVPGGGTSSLNGAEGCASDGEDARRDFGWRYRMLVGRRLNRLKRGGLKRDVLVIEIVMEFIVESLNVLVRRNDLLQIMVLK